MSAIPASAACFDDVAANYDAQPNPLLALEERVLPGFLPDLHGMDVIDIGCGTGRWLTLLHNSAPRSLKGIDPSAKMLEVASSRLAAEISLELGCAEALPVADSVADIVLLSFVLSYCESLDSVVRELARIARPGCAVVISDVHPGTEARLHWKRTFLSSRDSVAMPTTRHDFRAVADRMRCAGFEQSCYLEVPFGSAEESIFAAAGMHRAFEDAREVPAVYLAQFVRRAEAESFPFAVCNARVALDAETAVPAEIKISGDSIVSIEASEVSSSRDTRVEIDLDGCMVMPGLINAHDHLEFGLFPNLGCGPYDNSVDWAQDIHSNHRKVIDLHSRVSKDVRFYWGALRNLLSGVTSVCHHNPASALFREPDFPVRVLDQVSWAHSLWFEPKAPRRFYDSPQDHPFVLHASEGTDPQTAREISELDRLGILTDRTVLVHGVNCSPEDIRLVNARGAALIVCPSSNQFLFQRTVTSEAIATVEKLALGTDSAMTAQGDLLDEIRIANTSLQLSAPALYRMCTVQGASIFSLRSGEGRLHSGGRADLLIVRDSGEAPSDRILSLRTEDIEIVILGGRVFLASDSSFERLPEQLRFKLAPLYVDGCKYWVRAPLEWMFAEAQAVLGRELRLGGKEVAYAG